MCTNKGNTPIELPKGFTPTELKNLKKTSFGGLFFFIKDSIN